MNVDAWGWVVAAVAWLYAFGLHVERIIDLKRREAWEAERRALASVTIKTITPAEIEHLRTVAKTLTDTVAVLPTAPGLNFDPYPNAIRDIRKPSDAMRALADIEDLQDGIGDGRQ